MTGEISLLPGQIVSALTIGAVLAYPLARLLLWRYERAVERVMRTAAPAARGVGQSAAPATTPPASSAVSRGPWPPLLSNLRGLPWRAAAVQAFAAVVVAVWFAGLQIAAWDIGFSPWRVAVLAIPYLWPGVLAVLLVAGISRRQRIAVLALGTTGYLLLGVVASTVPPVQALGEAVQLWVVVNLLPTLYLGAFLTPRVRSVGPLVLLVCLLAVAGAVALQATLAVREDWLQGVGGVLIAMGLGPYGAIAAILLVGAGIALVVGVWLLGALARAYAAHRVGDQGMMLAALWLVFVLSYSVSLIFSGQGYFGLGLLAFPAYLLLVRPLRALLLPRQGETGPALLLLRVFARKGAAPALFRALSRHWRHVGPIRMIAGYDLATEAIEPDELMAFLRGHLDDSFVTGPAVVDRRLGETTARRDADGRFRAEEFFCFDDTWRYTLQRLVAASDLVLMDLRGFGPGNRGCVFELAALAEAGAMSRTLLLHDASTDMAALRDESAKLGVPGAALPLLALKGDESHDLPALLAALARTAGSPR